jgi:hypothetical protein
MATIAENKESISKAPAGRPVRRPVSGRNILTVKGKDPAYEYRIVNDDADRVARFQEGGYELVSDESVKVGDNRVSLPTAEGTVKQMSVGQGRKAFLMRIKKEWYDEDQKEKQKKVDELEATTKANAMKGMTGTITGMGA